MSHHPINDNNKTMGIDTKTRNKITDNFTILSALLHFSIERGSIFVPNT
jgi:hypothetical protein